MPFGIRKLETMYKDYFVHTTKMINPKPMKTTPTDFRKWQMHIRKACVNCIKPDHSETIRQWRINYSLLGRIIQSKNA